MKLLLYTHSDYSWVWKYWHQQTDKFLNDFEKAGKAFETADEFERAAHCYERAGDKKSAITMRCRIAETGSQTPIKDEISITNPFQMDLADTALETKPDASKVLKNIAEPNELEAATIIHTNLPSINNSLEVNLKVENFNKSKFRISTC